jgi:hypothetical protein
MRLSVGVDHVLEVSCAHPRADREAKEVDQFLVRANTMLDFAGHLGLIESEEDGQIRRAVGRDHPELDQWLEDEDKRLSGET